MTVHADRVALLCDDLLNPGLVQGKRALRRQRSDGTDAWCCLGRACEIYRTQTGKGEWVRDVQARVYDFVVERDRSWLVMPRPVQAFYGFTVANPVLYNRRFSTEEGWEQSLHVAGGWNDHGVPFSEISEAFRNKYVLLVDEDE